MTRKYHPDNERTKRRYLTFLKEAKRHGDASVEAAAAAIARFEAWTKYRDFRTFHRDQAIAFKRNLAATKSKASSEALSKATLHATLTNLKRFFEWLAQQQGYRSRLTFSDAEYFNLSEKETRVATARRDRPVPTLEQVRHVLATMPEGSLIERRNRALVAFILITGARDSAVASLKLKHVDLAGGSVFQDARDVKTKFSKTFRTWFLPVDEGARRIVEQWVICLREGLLWNDDNPLFPSTVVRPGESSQFEVMGLSREHWASAAPIREIFRAAFQAAGLPYFNPHSFRKTLAQIGESMCQTPEEFKAWSQNLGHESVLTTFYSYGTVAESRQAEIIGSLAKPRPNPTLNVDELAEALSRRMFERNAQVTGPGIPFCGPSP